MKSRPGGRSQAAHADSAATKISKASIAPTPDNLTDIDALAEHLRGRFVLQVTIDGEHRRTLIYRSAAAAEKAARRAQERGQQAHVALCQLLPVGVIVGLDGGR